ncbi:hypothetical protein [Methanobacterium aggregans]|uniref:hypothetical protein n=1 Tax=Methanobacterium aggregans TaxID=1615586 RepID=UPI00320FC9F7
MVYDILIPTVPVLGSYLITYALYRRGLIKKSLHVSVWNFIIGISFLVCGGAGFILLILLDMGVALPISKQLLYWHVEFGVTMALVTVFHFHIYWKGTKAMLGLLKRRSGS